MNLSTKQWHASLYKYFYNSSLPNNLCPYFWKIMISLLFVIPFTILSIPVLIIDYLNKGKQSHSLVNYSIMGFCMYIALFIISLPFIFIYQWIFWGFNNLNDLGVYGLLMSIFTISCFLIYRLYISYKNRDKKENSPNIFIEFIKAKYNKYCPKIDWKE